MNKYSKPFFKENLWVLKIILSLTSIILTVVYSIPLLNTITSYNSSDKNEIPLFMSFDETKKNSESTENEASVSIPVSAETEASYESTEAVTEKTTYIYETPDDIKALESSYLETFSNREPAGSVKEVFFKTSGATDTVQGISIKNATQTKKPDFSALINEGPELSINDCSEPVVLIFHTHTTESYLLSDNGVFYEDYATRSTNSNQNMIRVGDEICKVLEANGIGYIHDKNIYDESYNGAYARSRESIEKYKKDYPTLKIILDVHRDAIYYSDTSHCKPTAEINGRKAAQIMIITGAQEGYITDFPDWEDNLRFALCFQKTAENMYPGIMKPVYFCQRKYNMDTAKCSLLLEIGTDANTLDEAVYSGYLTGQILTDIIKNNCEEK